MHDPEDIPKTVQGHHDAQDEIARRRTRQRAKSAPHIGSHLKIASKTGARSPSEELITCKHLGGRGLLLQGLARLVNQPRVLHRDDRLRREVLQQRDLLVGERPDFLAIKM